jgi:hypothetical protein
MAWDAKKSSTSSGRIQEYKGQGSFEFCLELPLVSCLAYMSDIHYTFFDQFQR